MNLTVRMMLRKIQKRKFSIILSAFIIAWAMAMMVTGIYSSGVIRTSANAYLDETGLPDISISLFEGVDPQQVQTLMTDPAIKTYEFRLRMDGHAIVDGKEISVQLIGLKDPFRTDINRLLLLDGRMFSEKMEAVAVSGGQVLGDHAKVLINSVALNLNITGTVRSPEFLINDLPTSSFIPGSGGLTILYLPLETLQSSIGPVINDILIMSDNNASKSEVISGLSSLPISSTILREDQQTSVIVQMGADKMMVMLPSISLVFIFIGLVSTFMTIYRLVLSDSRSIGVLMSLGITRKHIATSYLMFGVVTLSLGAILGCILGYAFTYTISNMALGMMGAIPIVMGFDLLPFLIGLSLATLVVVVAVIIPITIVLRHDVHDALSFVPRNRIWAWRTNLRSLSLALGLRNLFREPSRTIIFLVIIALSIGAAGSWMFMVDSAQGYLEEQSSANKWDVKISFNGPMSDIQAISHFASDPVKSAIPFSTLVGQASLGDNSQGVFLLAASDIVGIRSFLLRQGELDFQGAVLAKKMADNLGARPGESITFAVGNRSLPIEVTGIVDDIQGNAIYTSNDQVLDIIGEGSCTGVFIVLDSSEQARSYSSSLSGDPLVGSIVLKDDTVTTLRGMFDSSMSLLYAFFALNLMIALAVAISATIISTSERDMEYTTVISLGLPRSFQVKALVYEVGAQAMISALLAVPFAFLLAQVFTSLLEDAVFYIPVVLSLATVITVLVIGFLFISISIIWPLRRIKRIDFVKVLRERISS
ncbi:MAG: FtsX-like permease family protein [Methanomassiliicoccales archaeon PtaU1.Bin124]|nr:MAG: FtsX-like permease family protein [Methanomassiliicoccales archaeon PtaU1.Bin124]